MSSITLPSTFTPAHRRASGVLTFTTNGVPHLEIERRYAKALDDAYRKGVRDGRLTPASIELIRKAKGNDPSFR